MKTTFTNIFWQEGKYFVGLCLELDISSFGETKLEAEKMLQEAVQLSMEDVKPDDFRFNMIKNPILTQSELTYA